MDQNKIDHLADVMEQHPVLGPATRLLQQYKDWVNCNSDGWAYWGKARLAADHLVRLIEANPHMPRNDLADCERALLAAVRPTQRFINWALRTNKVKGLSPWPKFKDLADLSRIEAEEKRQGLLQMFVDAVNEDPLWSFLLGQRNAGMTEEGLAVLLKAPELAGVGDPVKIATLNMFRNIQRNPTMNLKYGLVPAPKTRKPRKKAKAS